MKRGAALLLCLALLLPMCGCMLSSVNELYSLPQPSEEYLRLQELIDEEIAAGCEYSAPTSGSYRQIVHTYDLNGDGEAEALAFLRDADQVPKICIYSRFDGEYALARTITGEGSAIGSIDYADMDGDGWAELIVSWQSESASGIGILNVYSLAGYSGEILLTTDSTAFRIADMNGDGCSDLLVLHTTAAEGFFVDMFSLSTSRGMEQATAKLSSGVTAVDRLRTGQLSDGVTALFAEGACGESSTVTDIFTADADGLTNITADSQTGVSVTTRDYAVYATDIDSDRVLEVPYARQLEKYSEDASTYWAFDWYAFDSGGDKALRFSTYHCYADGWYIRLPEDLSDCLVVRREASVSGERAIVLSRRDPESGETTDLLYIYTLTGDNRRERAKLSGRFTLSESGSTIYAGKLAEGASCGEQDVIDSFGVIYTEWSSGAL